MQRNSFNKIIMMIVIVAISQYNVKAQTKNEFSVKQTVDYGLKNAVQVKNALIDIKNQEEVNREITSQALPQIKAAGAWTDYLNIPLTPIPGALLGQAAGTFVEVPFTTKFTSSGSVTLNQTLFDGQVFVGLKARATAIDFYKKQAEVTEDQIKANIYKIYYQLIVGQKQLASVQSNIDNLDKQLHDTREIYKNGFAEKLDVDKLTVQLNNLQTQKQVVENQLAAGNTGLKFLINMPQKEELTLTDTLSEDELKANILEENYNYNDRKDVQLLTLNAKLQGYNVKRYQMNMLPTLSGTASYSKTAYGSQFDFINSYWYTASYIGLNLSVPIFEGFFRQAKIQEAKYALEEANNNLEHTKQSIDNDVTQSRINMKSALATIDNQKQNIQLAESVFNSTTLKYAQGLGSNQEIYDAQTQLQVAQNNYYSALYDAIIAKINYLQAVGKL
jgi:outer membrane protein